MDYTICLFRRSVSEELHAMIITLVVLSLLAFPVWADDIVICDPSNSIVSNRVVGYQHSVDVYKSGAIENPNVMIWSLPTSTVRPWDGIPPPGSFNDWKCIDTNVPSDGVLDDVVEMTPSEKDSLVQDEKNASDSAVRNNADSSVTSFSEEGVRLRAAVICAMQYVNEVRTDPLVAKPEVTKTDFLTCMRDKIAAKAAD